MRQQILLFIIVCGMFVAGQGPAWARLSGSDGFVAAKRFETAYFTVSIAPGVDEERLAKSLEASLPSEIAEQESIPDLGGMLDGFYEWAGRLLDMPVTGYHGDIKVVQNAKELRDIYLRLYGTESSPFTGFYVFEEDTLYVAASDFTQEVIAHELSHVVVSNYFVVQPPAKAAEVLAGYIEYQLRELIKAKRHDDDKG
jgi:hypothetical protein